MESEKAQLIIAAVELVAILALVVVTCYYAWQTSRQANAAEKTVEAAQRSAEAAERASRAAVRSVRREESEVLSEVSNTLHRMHRRVEKYDVDRRLKELRRGKLTAKLHYGQGPVIDNLWQSAYYLSEHLQEPVREAAEAAREARIASHIAVSASGGKGDTDDAQEHLRKAIPKAERRLKDAAELVEEHFKKA